MILRILGTVGFAVALLATMAKKAHGADLLGKVTVAPVAVIQTLDLTGASQFGAGVDLGYKVNSFVGVHVVNLAFEQRDWGGSVVDETDLLIRADITKFKINTFTPYFIGGGLYDWNTDSFGMSVGFGGQINFTKNIGAGGDYSVQFLEDGGKRGLTKFFLNFSF